MASELFKKTEGLLYNLKYMDEKIRSLELHIKKLDEDIYDDGLSYGDKSSQTYKVTSTVENHVIQREKDKITEKQNELRRMISKIKYDKQIIEIAISTLNDKEKEFVKLRYYPINKPLMSAVAMKLYISEHSCSDLRKTVIMKLSKILFPYE